MLQSDWYPIFTAQKGVRTKKSLNVYQTSLPLVGGVAGQENTGPVGGLQSRLTHTMG